MIRYSLLSLVIAFLVVYAWRDWYKTLCALILMVAVVEHPEMPTGMLGIQGLNPWNLVLVSVCLSWLAHRGVEDLRVDLPKSFTLLLLAYVIVMIVAFLRGIGDTSGLTAFSLAMGEEPPTKTGLIADGMINTFKWIVPGLLLFTSARTYERNVWGGAAIVGVTFLLAVLVIRWMPVTMLTDGDQLSNRALRVLDRETGYHRVDLAAMMAAGFWAAVNYRAVVQSRVMRFGLVIVAAVSLLALALTGGRMGYVTWGALGLLFAAVRSKKQLLIIPLVVAVVFALVPAAQERMLRGFDGDDSISSVQATGPGAEPDEAYYWHGINLHAVTSGRILAWPRVIEEIKKAPWFGYGRYAMQRRGIALELEQTYNEAFGHPHNAYLEALLDNGILGALPMFLFFALLIKEGLKVLRDRSAPYESALAGVTLSFIAAQLIASLGSQSFYPKAGTVAMWCAIGLFLRMLVDRRKRLAAEAAEQTPGARRARAQALRPAGQVARSRAQTSARAKSAPTRTTV